MRRIVIATAMSLSVLSLAAISSADTLIMRDGTRVEGTLVSFAARTITFRHADGVSRRYFTSQVEALEFFSAERANPGAVSGRSLEAPAGTELVVRTVETIDSRNSGADQTFSAIVEQGVTNAAGHVIVPTGSSAQLMIRQMSSGGATGSPEMALDVHSLTVAGRRYLLSTADVTLASRTGIGKNRRTAETIGGGAALGTVIGAIAGGGKGAAIGGLAGAAGGAAVQVLTRGRDVQVPAETVLKFTLDRAVTLQPER
ncbi:MAG TPA: hypothetical protein VK886_19280 [Vicinamibacterales bacterium]|nr:hypothetical protein [Vicinamibacterales bacterium]